MPVSRRRPPAVFARTLSRRGPMPCFAAACSSRVKALPASTRDAATAATNPRSNGQHANGGQIRDDGSVSAHGKICNTTATAFTTSAARAYMSHEPPRCSHGPQKPQPTRCAQGPQKPQPTCAATYFGGTCGQGSTIFLACFRSGVLSDYSHE